MKINREIKAQRRLATFLWERKYISESNDTIRFYKRAAHKAARRMGKKICQMEAEGVA
jgi:hypothetical protein